MKNEKGITLISLVTTVILIIILASIGTYTGVESYNSMRVQAFVSKMITLQEKVDIFCDTYSVKEINEMSFPPAVGEAETVLNEVISRGDKR